MLEDFFDGLVRLAAISEQLTPLVLSFSLLVGFASIGIVSWCLYRKGGK